MISRLGEWATKWAQRLMPDPFLFVVLLTFVTVILGPLLVGARVVGTRDGAGAFQPGMLDHWWAGVWDVKMVAFALQMCLVLVTGHALAVAPPVRRGLRRLAAIPRTGRQAVVATTMVALVTGLLNWGLSLVASAYFAKEVALEGKRRGLKFHYPLLAASSYLGLMIWHGGFSGSAPLQVATPGHKFEKEMGGVLPITETLFHPANLLVCGLLLVACPILVALLVPSRPEGIVEIAADPGEDAPLGGSTAPKGTLARLLDEAWPVTLGVVALGGAVLLWSFLGWAAPARPAGLRAVSLESVIFLFLIAGMALHRTPIAYVRAIEDGIGGAAGIVLQFPFYLGIMGMVQLSGLGAEIARWFVSLSNASGSPQATFPVLMWLAASVLNMFVTSGGGLWAVAGGTTLAAASSLGVPSSKALLAVAYGDEWTNMIQPFWAVPLLAITGVRAGDIMGYTAIVMLATGPIYAIGLALL